MKLYVANATRQDQRVYYRLDVDKAGTVTSQIGVLPKHVDIKPGRQEAVGGELAHVSQLDTIIDQLTPFGAVKFDETNRLNHVAAYVYRVDQPVPKSVIDKVFNYNQATLDKVGHERRQTAAIVAGTVIASDEAKISIEQMEESELGGKSIAEGYTVDKTPGAIAQSERQTGVKRRRKNASPAN
jgi:hypothetical protein